MEAHRTESIVEKDGSVTVRGVPFREGERVEVIILPHEHEPSKSNLQYPLRGSVRRFDQPFDPAADASDWGALGDAG
jgi:hypothetical protein